MKVDRSIFAALICGLWTHVSNATGWPEVDGSTLKNGQTIVIPSWELAPSSVASRNITWLSIPGNGGSSLWYRVPVSRCTIIACLHEAAIPPWDDLDVLYFSDNLEQYQNDDLFNGEWLYRREFTLSPRKNRHFFLETHGITPAANIILNEEQLATRDIQAGSYGGRVYDITSVVQDVNALLITVYPTSYDYDFAQGFVDWNPYPPNNGTGIWRNVTLKQTGPVLLDQVQIETRFTLEDLSEANFTVRAIARNLEDRNVTVDMTTELFDPETLRMFLNKTETVDIGPQTWCVFTFQGVISSPPIWWPWQWGEQPLLRAQLTASADSARSDLYSSMVGIREITSQLNKHSDLVFFVNRKPFQILGAGYSPDLFLRWDNDRFGKMCKYILDIGMNTIRLEGKMEQPELYELANRLGLMVLPGWECCDKWEAWSYNTDLSVSPFPTWKPADYATARASMQHETSMLQGHPSVLGFMVGSDFHPDDNATDAYVAALEWAGWQLPVISSGAQRGYPARLGPSGMKMNGPYDWVPPNYWWDTKPASKREGAAFGFGSELGAGVGMPEMGSLLKFMRQDEIDELWKSPNASSYHTGAGKTFSNRKIYHAALFARYGAPTDAADYVQKAQMVDYEATRAQFEAYAAMWDAARPATGLIYWMLNNAWPSLQWNLFDYYLRAAGSYFGAKTGSRLEHVAYDYKHKGVHLISRSRPSEATVEPNMHCIVHMEAIDMNGRQILDKTVEVETRPNTSRVIVKKLHELNKIQHVAFLRLKLVDANSSTLSRNVYWLTKDADQLAWDDSDWRYTPVKRYADYTALNRLPRANVTVTARRMQPSQRFPSVNVTLHNHSPVPAVFVRLNLVNKVENEKTLQMWEDVVPVAWEDNYVTLWPNETMMLLAEPMTDIRAAYLQVDGKNVDVPWIVQVTDN